jgi:hypothetical protein
MRFPPPVRYYAPLLVLVCGLADIWLDYELNLAIAMRTVAGAARPHLARAGKASP